MSNLTEREAFEAWHLGTFKREPEKRPAGYLWNDVQHMWLAFQSGAAWRAQAPDPLSTQEKPYGLP